MDTVLKILIFLKIGCVVLFPLEDQENHVGMTKLVFFVCFFCLVFIGFILFSFVCVSSLAHMYTQTHSVGCPEEGAGCPGAGVWAGGSGMPFHLLEFFCLQVALQL